MILPPAENPATQAGGAKIPTDPFAAKSGQSPAEDTAAGCHGRASADREAASAMDTENGRLRMENSARSWTERATLLEGEDGLSYRATLKAEWDAGERPMPTRKPETSAPNDLSEAEQLS